MSTCRSGIDVSASVGPGVAGAEDGGDGLGAQTGRTTERGEERTDEDRGGEGEREEESTEGKGQFLAAFTFLFYLNTIHLCVVTFFFFDSLFHTQY